MMSEANTDSELKVILLGDSGVGKSSLLERFLLGTFSLQSIATVGVDMNEKWITVDGKQFTLQIWDTAGQERFHSLRTPFYRGAHACMLVFALDNKKSFDDLAHWLEELQAHTDLPDLHRFPVVVVGNKADVPLQLDTTDSVQYRHDNDVHTKREVTETEASQWCCMNGPYPYMESSAKDTVNVTQAFEAVVRTYCNLTASNQHTQNGAVYSAHQADTTQSVNLKLGQTNNTIRQNNRSTCCK